MSARIRKVSTFVQGLATNSQFLVLGCSLVKATSDLVASHKVVLTSGQKGSQDFSQAGLLAEQRLKKGNFCAFCSIEKFSTKTTLCVFLQVLYSVSALVKPFQWTPPQQDKSGPTALAFTRFNFVLQICIYTQFLQHV